MESNGRRGGDSGGRQGGGPRPFRGRPGDRGRREAAVAPPSDELLFGRNPVLEALRSGQPLRRITVQTDIEGRPLAEVFKLAGERDVPITRADRRVLDQVTAGGAHQGVVAYTAAVAYASLDDILQRAAAAGEEPFLLVCDGVSDPHNLGALIRSAEGAGCQGVIIPERRSAGLTGTVAKASAGAVAHIPVAQVTNLTKALEELKKAGYWVVGAAMEGEKTLWEQDLQGPIAVVIGAEGGGLSRLVTEHCDFLVHIPMRGRVASLNASVAGALLMYEVVRQRVLVQSSLETATTDTTKVEQE